MSGCWLTRATAAASGLLLRYGYPLPESGAALKACAASHDIECIPIDRFNLEHLIGNLYYSINQTESGPLQDDLLELCNRLEPAERYDHGELDVL